MVYSVLVLLHRKAGLTPAAFRSYYEDSHLKLFEKLAGPVYPQRHVRRYLARAQDDSPIVMFGPPEYFDYDVMVEMDFADQGAFGKFVAKMQEPDIEKTILEDEKNFLDRTNMKFVVLGDRLVTEGPKTGSA